MRWARRFGALLLWAAAQSLFVLPRGIGTPGWLTIDPATYQPLIPPAFGVVLNVAIAAAFLWWFPWRVLARREWRRAATFRLRPVPPAAWRPIVATGLAVVVGGDAALLVLPRLLPFAPEGDPLISAYVRQPLGPLALAVIAVGVAPLLEEFLFRGWIQRRLERWVARWATPGATPWVAIGLTALLFAAVHGQRFGFVPRAAFAVAAGYAAWATRSIWASVALHAMYNGGLLVATPIVALLLPRLADADDRSVVRAAQDGRVFWPALAGLVLGVVGGVRALRRVRASTLAARAARPRAARARAGAGVA